MNTNVYQLGDINQAQILLNEKPHKNIDPFKNKEIFIISVLQEIYYRQLRNSKLRSHSPPTYTKIEFIKRFENDPKFISLFENWVKNGCQKYLKPSFDRIDNSKGYSFENINLTTWAENAINGNISRRKTVSVFKKGRLISQSVSQVEAAKLTGHSIDYIKKIQDTGKESPRGYSFAK